MFVAKASFVSFNHGFWHIIELWGLSCTLSQAELHPTLQPVGDSLGESKSFQLTSYYQLNS